MVFGGLVFFMQSIKYRGNYDLPSECKSRLTPTAKYKIVLIFSTPSCTIPHSGFHSIIVNRTSNFIYYRTLQNIYKNRYSIRFKTFIPVNNFIIQFLLLVLCFFDFRNNLVHIFFHLFAIQYCIYRKHYDRHQQSYLNSERKPR